MKWAVIGSGDVWQTKSRGVFDDIGGTVPSREYKHFADGLIGHPAVDAVYICTPPDSHLHYARLAAKHKKPCLVEKPMALDAVEAGIMASLFLEAGVPLWVAYYRRCLPRFLRIKELIDTGAIGKVRFCHIQHTLRPECHPVAPVIEGQPIPWRYDPKIAGRGGNFTDMGTHHLDLVDYLLGRIGGVNGWAANKGGLYEAEDTVYASFDAGGVGVTGQWCYVAGVNLDSMKIVGSEGMIEFDVFKDTPVAISSHGKNWGASFEDIPNPRWVHQPLVQSIVDELNGKGRCPTNWENGLRVMTAQEKILGAAQD